MTAAPDPTRQDDPLSDGMAMRRRIHGSAHVDLAWQAAQADPHRAALQQLLTETAWGRIWTRPGLPLPTRSLLVVAILAALGREHELAVHARSAVARNGCTAAELKEVALMVAAYCGIPAAVDAFAIIERAEQELAAAT